MYESVTLTLTLLIVWKARLTFPAEKAVFKEESRMLVRLTLPLVFTMTVAVALPDELKMSVAALKSVMRYPSDAEPAGSVAVVNPLRLGAARVKYALVGDIAYANERLRGKLAESAVHPGDAIVKDVTSASPLVGLGVMYPPVGGGLELRAISAKVTIWGSEVGCTDRRNTYVDPPGREYGLTLSGYAI